MVSGIGKSKLADETLKWISQRCDPQRLETYLAHPQGIPLLVMPWWLEASIRGEVDAEFQASLIASSSYGYLFIRMLDDLMDGHEIERVCFPALHLFSYRFQSIYSRYFPSGDSFWEHFERSLAATAEAESADCGLGEVSAEDFLSITARKTSAALIPIAAVCCRYDRLDLLPLWERFVTLFARWHQMRDDILDWSEDHESGHATWMLTEAQRRRAADESVSVWMGRTGLKWAAAVMEGWMIEIKAAAQELHSPELVRYLDARDATFSRQMAANIRLASLYESLLHL